jgi:hypothetical protein
MDIGNGTTVFFGKKYFLSNHFPAPFVDTDGVQFRTSEHHYMTSRALFFGRSDLARDIAKEANPGRVINMAKEVLRGFADHDRWAGAKDRAMAVAGLQPSSRPLGITVFWRRARRTTTGQLAALSKISKLAKRVEAAICWVLCWKSSER